MIPFLSPIKVTTPMATMRTISSQFMKACPSYLSPIFDT
jgi:hypothetical protein